MGPGGGIKPEAGRGFKQELGAEFDEEGWA